ncbi:hypothetical protein QYM36_019809 [Artemia franciscana]|uniref:Uncharacterized protein n=1 Tax=Artemia franciscana TaxID=6661 RepID=A0AA88H4S8_ARTSF|nr:hypothetical protein QYM36_019809 [Artemia franciscana]
MLEQLLALITSRSVATEYSGTGTMTERIGGGTGIYIRADILSKLLTHLSDPNHKVIRVQCMPRNIPRDVCYLIFASIYYPESAKNRWKLHSYLQTSVDGQQQQYSRPGLSILGILARQKTIGGL